MGGHNAKHTEYCRECGGSGYIYERIWIKSKKCKDCYLGRSCDRNGNPYVHCKKSEHRDTNDRCENGRIYKLDHKKKKCPRCGGKGILLVSDDDYE